MVVGGVLRILSVVLCGAEFRDKSLVFLFLFLFGSGRPAIVEGVAR